MPEAAEAGGPPPARDTTRAPEIRDSREAVVNAFNSAYSLFESYPEDKLTPGQQAARDLIKDIKGKTLDKEKGSYLNRFESEDGDKFSQREYLPVDELILFLRERVKSGELTAEDETEYRGLEKILHKNSQEYYRGAAKKDYPRKMARMRQEAQRISSDSKLTKGDPREDFLEAGRILFERRELIIPPSSSEPPPPPGETEPESESETIPETEPETIEQNRREFIIINRNTDIQRKARELTEAQLRNEMRRGSFLNPLNWPRKIGLRIMEEFYRQRYIQRASQAMLENSNSYLSMDVVRNAAVDAAHSLSEERQAGQEKIEQLRSERLIEGQEIFEVQGALREEMINSIIRPTVEGEITNQEQVQQRLRDFVQSHQDDPQVQSLFGQDANEYGRRAEYFATDLLETGELVRQDIAANRYAIEQLDNVIQIRLANTSWGAETQARLSAVDRAVAWAERHRLTGALINPATLGAGFSIATFGLMRGLGVGAKITQVVVPGAGLLPGALFAAVRRNYDLKIDRASVQIEQGTYNQRAEEGARRREALEQFSYNTASVEELINGGGQELLTGGDRQSLEQLLSQDLSEGQMANREAVVRRIAEIQSRLDFSSRERVDLVTYQSREQVEQGRLGLIRCAVEATQALRNAGMSNEEIQELENGFTGNWNSRFTQNREQQDRAFARYRLRNAAGAAVFGGAVGLGMGFGMREGLEHLGANPVGGAIDKVRELLGHHEESSAPNAENFKDLYSQGGSVEVNDHLKAVVSPADHTVSIIDSNTNEAAAGLPNITLTPDGHMTAIGEVPAQTHDELQQAGFSINQGADILTPSSSDILTPSDTHIENVMGHPTTIPNGTEWIQDPADQSKWDLVVSTHPDKTLISDAHFDASGKIVDWDHANSMDSLISVSSTPGESQIITGGGVADEWLKHGTQIGHREWYSYDQPQSQGNELRLYDAKQGDSVILDMSRMGLAYQEGLTPNPINVQDVINNHESGFAFSLPGHEGQPIWIPDGADGQWDGLLNLNPNDTTHFVTMPDGTQMSIADFSKMVVNQDLAGKFPDGNIASELYNQQDLFRLGANGEMGFIEAGRMVDQNGEKVLQAFATIRGSAEAQAVIPGNPLPVINLTGNITETVQVTTPSFDIIPPPGEHPEIPIIPIPFAPRHPLESSLENILILYGYGGSYSREGLGWVDRSEYEKRRSKTLNENPYARLDESIEVADYLSRMDPEYRSELERMDDTIGDPMSSEARAVITIPAFGEGKIIRKTLEQFLGQKDKNGNPINPNLFEIIVFENDTDQRPKDETEEEIRKFKADHPELKVYYTFKRWSPDDIANKVNTVGNGRRYNCDLALLRGSKRTTASGELIIINNDADLEGIKPKYITDVIEEFDSKDYLDVVVGKRNLPDWALSKPNIRTGQRLWETFDAVMRHTGGGDGLSPDEREKGWPGMIGENSAMRASIYAAVGGYGPRANLAEDQNLGDMIRTARNYEDQRFEYVNRLQTIKNPRRYLTYMIAGRSLIEMYNDYHENKNIRNLNNEQLLNRISDTFDIDRFQLDADGIYQKRNDYRHLGGGDGFDLRFKKTMNLMGVEYIIENGHVKILNVDRLLEGLKRPIPSTNPPSSSRSTPTPTPPTST